MVRYSKGQWATIPMQDKGSILGFFLGTINMERFTKSSVDSIKLGRSGYVFLLDNDGLFLAHPDKKKLFKENISQFAWGKQVMNQEQGNLAYEYEGINKLLVFQKLKATGWTVACCQPASEFMAAAQAFGRLNLMLGLASLALTVLVIFLMLKSLIKPMTDAIYRINANAIQVKSGGDQITAVSRSLAEGSSEQAASLEETSSSLEEMSSMTTRNAESAKGAKTISDEARLAAESGANNIQELNRVISQVKTASQEMRSAMDAVKSSNDEVSKIIKTIDEIAFQTNILALNAAVEAARAGEAGLGFAAELNSEAESLMEAVTQLLRLTDGGTDETPALSRDASAQPADRNAKRLPFSAVTARKPAIEAPTARR